VYATGMAKLGFKPRVGFMDLLVDECEARELQDFKPLHLAIMLNGADPSVALMCCSVAHRKSLQVMLVAGFVKLGYCPGDSFMELFVRVCADHIERFKCLDVALVIKGELQRTVLWCLP
jgi:hypothetical protein